MLKFLALYANPRGAEKLQLHEEMRSIQDDIEWTQVSQIKFDAVDFVKKSDLLRKLQHYQPDVILFSGHGTEDGSLVLEDEKRRIAVVPPQVLESIFLNFKDSIKCVVLLCCFSDKQAKAISKHIPFVIGMKDEIDDKAARLFASKFFQSVVLGYSIQKSFNMAKIEVSLIEENWEDIPSLFSKRNCNPETAVLLPKPRIEAKFKLNANGRPIKSNDLFELEVFITNAPQEVSTVFYQYLEPAWDLEDQIEECRNPKTHFTDTLSEDGDIEIRASLWRSNDGTAISCTLGEALRSYYKTNLTEPINAAIKAIEANR